MSDKKTEINFEKSLEGLESIVDKLGNEQVSLDDMIKLYQKGVELKNNCLNKISEAKLKVEDVLNNENN